MSERDDQIAEEAISWAIRCRDPGFTDWAGFTLWLETDPAHNRAYETAVLAGEDAAALLAAAPAHPRPAPAPVDLPEPANDAPVRTGRRRFIGFAIAASLAAVTSYTLLKPNASGTLETVQTAPGERKTIKLADGSRIELNGGSRLQTDPARPRFAKLDAGEAAFVIVHDDRNPFVVETGGVHLQDAGTAFNVRRLDRRTEVAVSEGLVIFNPAAEAVRLPPGKRLSVIDGRTPVVGSIATDAVAAWRQGRLVYDGARLGDVAADLTRNTGQRVTATPAVADQPFTGVITLDSNDRQLFERIGPLLGVKVEHDQQGWMLTKNP